MTCTTADQLPARPSGRGATAIALVLTLVSIALLGTIATPAHAADDPLLPSPGVCANDTASAGPITLQREAAYCLINAVRRNAGVPTLRFCVMSGAQWRCNFGTGLSTLLVRQRLAEARALNDGAQYKAADLMNCTWATPDDRYPTGNPHHVCGRATNHWPAYFGYPYQVLENIAGQGGTPTASPMTARAAVDAWLKSTRGHRENLLSASVRTLGIGVVAGTLQNSFFAPRGWIGNTWAAQFGVG